MWHNSSRYEEVFTEVEDLNELDLEHDWVRNRSENEPCFDHDVEFRECERNDAEINDIACLVELFRDDVKHQNDDHGYQHVLDCSEVVLFR